MNSTTTNDDVELPATVVLGDRDGLGKLHKDELARRAEIHCGHCRYHKGENRTHHSIHSDHRKRHVGWKVERAK